MISDKSFDENGYDKLFHPGAVSEAVNEFADGNDGVLQLYDRSIELEPRQRNTSPNTNDLFDRSHNKSNPQERNA